MSLTKEDLVSIRELVREEIAPLKEDIKQMKTGIDYLKHDVNAINKKIEFIQSDISGLREEIRRIKDVVHIP